MNDSNGLSIEGYEFILKLRKTKRGGGVGIFYKCKFTKYRHKMVEKIDSSIEQLWITFSYHKIKFVVDIYKCPSILRRPSIKFISELLYYNC